MDRQAVEAIRCAAGSTELAAAVGQPHASALGHLANNALSLAGQATAFIDY